MNTKIKYIEFKGIEKKEQILFKSYLNLAKNELDYQLVVLDKKLSKEVSPDVVISDSSYQYLEGEPEIQELPIIRVGNEIELGQENYIHRPVQWSDFKKALATLRFEPEEAGSAEGERLMSDEMRFVIADMDEEPTDATIVDKEDKDIDYADEYDYELANMSIDYHSFTNSEYVKVVEDVQGFHDEAPAGVKPDDAPVILVTDDESTSSNSVLVIETDSLDVWDMAALAEEQEQLQEPEPDSIDSDPEETDSENQIENEHRQAVYEKLQSGRKLSANDEYWLSSGEVFCDTDSLFVIVPEDDMIYSAKEPAKWGLFMRNRELTKLPLEPNWERPNELKAYPMSRVFWANQIAFSYRELHEEVELNQKYILERWPPFDVLELDNMLLKLCTMLFIEPESPQSLLTKTGYSRSIIYALVNACHATGILRKENEIEKQSILEIKREEEGMLDRIKGVFR